jgi:hypothetical protein
MIEDKFGDKCEPDDPNRCQSNVQTGQCPYKALPDTKYCIRHGGQVGQKKNEIAAMNGYRLAKWQTRVDQFAEHDQVKSLRAEIGITRMLLEEVINKCETSDQLLMFSGKIADLVTRVEKLVSSCHRIEASTGMLLDKSAALHLASVIVEIISRHVTEDDSIDTIAQEIMVSIVSHQANIEVK